MFVVPPILCVSACLDEGRAALLTAILSAPPVPRLLPGMSEIGVLARAGGSALPGGRWLPCSVALQASLQRVPQIDDVAVARSHFGYDRLLSPDLQLNQLPQRLLVAILGELWSGSNLPAFWSRMRSASRTISLSTDPLPFSAKYYLASRISSFGRSVVSRMPFS